MELTAHIDGAIDEKHVAIECPSKVGILFYNYKSFCSIVLLAICNEKNNFILFDIGQYGSNNGCRVISESTMGKLLVTP